MEDHSSEQATPSTEDAVMELIRLREVDASKQAETERELRAEIAALWLRLENIQRRDNWFQRLFG